MGRKTGIRLRGFLAAGLLGLGLAAASGVSAETATDGATLFRAPGVVPAKVIETLVETFDQVVFGSEVGLETTVIAKWSGPVGIALQGRITQTHAAQLQTHLGTLSRLTGLRFTQVKPDDPAQKIMFVFVRRGEMADINLPGVDPALVRRLAAEGGCYFLSFKKPADRIVFAVIVVNVERDPAHINSCLLEETTQSLGLPNDTNLMRPSIFSDRDRVTELNVSDRALVGALYDQRMTPGLSRSDAQAVARVIFTEMAAAQR